MIYLSSFFLNKNRNKRQDRNILNVCVYNIYRWNDETTCMYAKKGNWFYVNYYIYFFAKKEIKFMDAWCGIDGIQNWYSNFFSSINSNAIRADCLSEEKRGRKSKNHLSGQ